MGWFVMGMALTQENQQYKHNLQVTSPGNRLCDLLSQEYVGNRQNIEWF